MTLTAATNAPLNCGTIATAPTGPTFDKGRAAEFALRTVPQERVLSSGGYSTVTVDDATFRRHSSAATITDHLVEVVYSDPGSYFPVAITSGAPGVLASPVDGIAVAASGGTARLTATATGKPTVVRDVTVTYIPSETHDELLSITSGTLHAALTAAIDSRLAGAGTKPIFATKDAANSNYVRSTSCWAADVDLTCASPWSNYGTEGYTGTLISPRHIIYANHYRPVVGTVQWFVTNSNTIVTRTLSAIATVTGTDIAIGLLDSDVPGTIGFARVLPSNWASYLPTFAAGHTSLPVLTTRWGRPAIVSDLMAPAANWYLTTPANSTRRSYSEAIVGGDSGNPVFLVLGTQPILIGCYTTGGLGAGPSVVHYTTAINAVMATLGGGYSLTPVNLTGFASY
jgi:hypothetical protein